MKTFSPISAMIADMVKQTNEVYERKTKSAIDALTGMCTGCNDPFPISKLTAKRYRKPFGTGYTTGHFCNKCLKDSRVKQLFV